MRSNEPSNFKELEQLIECNDESSCQSMSSVNSSEGNGDATPKSNPFDEAVQSVNKSIEDFEVKDHYKTTIPKLNYDFKSITEIQEENS